MGSKKPRYCITKAGKCLGAKQNQKGASLLPKVTPILLSSQTWAENMLGRQRFFTQTHLIWAGYCFSSAMVPNVTEHNDFFNYDVTAKRTIAWVVTALKLVSSTSTELLGTLQSRASKSYLQQNTATAFVLGSLGHRTSNDMHWIPWEISPKPSDF